MMNYHALKYGEDVVLRAFGDSRRSVHGHGRTRYMRGKSLLWAIALGTPLHSSHQPATLGLQDKA
jgi:hypothetical protein